MILTNRLITSRVAFCRSTSGCIVMAAFFTSSLTTHAITHRSPMHRVYACTSVLHRISLTLDTLLLPNNVVILFRIEPNDKQTVFDVALFNFSPTWRT
jgi:hypothetical protein